MATQQQRVDAIVVGTGAGGACVAYQLAKAGMKVLALERGPWREHGELATKAVFGPPFMDGGRGDELKYVLSRFIMPDAKRERRFLRYSEHGQRESQDELTQSGMNSRLVGGGTVHYGGVSMRMYPVDFRMASTHGKPQVAGLEGAHQTDLRDWPVDVEDFQRWYSRAEQLIGVAGAPGSDLPPHPFSKGALRLQEGARRAGGKVPILPTPMAINSEHRNGRLPCQRSGLCQDFACRFEAKADMRVTLLREALKTGNLTIQPHTLVRRLLSSRRRVTGVDCLVGESNPRASKLSAPLVILACEAVETCRLLLVSGLGNRDVLGRYLTFHVIGGARALAPEPLQGWSHVQHTAYVDHYYLDREEDAEGQPRFLKTGTLLLSALGGPLQQAVQERLWGQRALRFFNEVYPYLLSLSYVGEGLPTAHNRVELLPDVVDGYGMPAVRIHYRPHPYDMAAGHYMEGKSVELLRQAGCVTDAEAAEELRPFLRKPPTARRLYHGSGGARFGEYPKTSVTTPQCRLHEVDILYLADASIFPTGAGVNLTLTIQANALRVGDWIARNHRHT